MLYLLLPILLTFLCIYFFHLVGTIYEDMNPTRFENTGYNPPSSIPSYPPIVLKKTKNIAIPSSPIPISLENIIRYHPERLTRSAMQKLYEEQSPLPSLLGCRLCLRLGQMCKGCFIDYQRGPTPPSSSPPIKDYY